MRLSTLLFLNGRLKACVSANDISSGSYNFNKVRTAFAGCHGILTATAYLRAGILSSRRHGQSVRLRSRYEPEDLSILATVMGITQETINHRKLVQELYDRQIIHRIAGVAPLCRSPPPPEPSASHIVAKAKHDEPDSDREDDYRGHGQPPADDEGGRYAIERQPPRKRRRTERSEAEHSVYFVDDDDDTEGARQDEIEDGEYLSDASVEERRSMRTDSSKNEKTRSYWLSKGLGMEGAMDDDSM